MPTTAFKDCDATKYWRSSRNMIFVNVWNEPVDYSSKKEKKLSTLLLQSIHFLTKTHKDISKESLHTNNKTSCPALTCFDFRHQRAGIWFTTVTCVSNAYAEACLPLLQNEVCLRILPIF